MTPPLVRSLLAPTAAIALTAFLLNSSPAVAQSVLERTPNLTGAWVGEPGKLYFNFLHRFDASAAPTRKVVNAPTFLTAYGFGGYALVGVHYTTASTLVPNHPNEWEVLARFSPLSAALGAAFEIGVSGAYNEAAESFDSELALAAPFGPVKVMGAARFFSDGFGTGESRWALGGGMTIRLSDHLALAGDITTPTGRAEDEDFGWGAALQVAIPFTPHTLSLQATNTNSATLQGSSIGSGPTRFGFEFTIPLTLSRYFGGGGPPSAPTPEQRLGARDLTAGDTVRITITNDGFEENNVVVPPGTYVLWVNEGSLLHTSTALGGLWDSPLLGRGESFGRVFTELGRHPYDCTPHEFMRGVIVVQEGGEP